jgi:hypothetical protein
LPTLATQPFSIREYFESVTAAGLDVSVEEGVVPSVLAAVTYVPHINGVHYCEMLGLDILNQTNSPFAVVVYLGNHIRLEGISYSIGVVLVLNPDLLHHAALHRITLHARIQKQFAQYHRSPGIPHPVHQLLKLFRTVKFAGIPPPGSPRGLLYTTNIVQYLQHLLNSASTMHKHVGWAHVLEFVCRARRVKQLSRGV